MLYIKSKLDVDCSDVQFFSKICFVSKLVASLLQEYDLHQESNGIDFFCKLGLCARHTDH